MEENKKDNRLFMYLLVVFFAVFVATGIFLTVSNKKDKADNSGEAASTSNTTAMLKQEQMVIPTLAPTEGRMSLKPAAMSFTLNDEVKLVLSAQSADKNIVGYDVVINYDPLAFEFVDAQSSLSDFTVYSYNRGSYILLTAVKSISSEAKTILGNEKLDQQVATLIFKPKKSGSFNFSLMTSAGQDATNLVTDQTEVLNPSLSDLTVEIK